MQGVALVRFAPLVRQPQVALWLDVDDSLATKDMDGLHESRDVLNEYSANTVVGFCTGRGVTTARNQAPLLAGFPLQYFAVNNGQNLYVNTEGEKAEDFIANLGNKQEDAEWAEIVRQAGGNWNTKHIRAIMQDTLKAEGFTPTPVRMPFPFDSHDVFVRDLPTSHGPEKLYFLLPQDQPAFHLKEAVGENMSSEAVAYDEHLAAVIGQRMKADGIVSHFIHYPPIHGKIINAFEPPGISKRALFEFVLSKYPSVYAAVTGGDNVNDDQLDPLSFGKVPNYAILGGKTHPRYEELSHHPNLIVCEPGHFAPGFRRQFEVIGLKP
jgi:hypothetical protein